MDQQLSMIERHHVDIHVDIPINRVIFFEFVRLVFDIVAIFENELEVGNRRFLIKSTEISTEP
jgi:hypothetical protein